jgi:hypothetical protein
MMTTATHISTPFSTPITRACLLFASMLLVGTTAIAQSAALNAATSDKSDVSQSVAAFRANQEAVQQREAAEPFAVVTPGTVKDSRTGLVWMRCSLGQDWDEKAKTCTGSVNVYDWKGAFDIAEKLNAVGGYAGSTKWRLPTAHELQSLRYCSKGFFTANQYMIERTKGVPKGCNVDSSSPTIAKTIFPNMDSKRLIYQSSSGESPVVVLVSFDRGIVGNGDTDKASAVRLVR